MVKGSQPQTDTSKHAMQQSYAIIMFTLAGEITNNSKLDDDLTNELMSMR